MSCVFGGILAPALATVSAFSATAQEERLVLADEIVVTAQRRAQSILDVPISVSAFGGMTLENAGVDNVFDLQQMDSSLSVSAQSGAFIPFIRGIGNIASQTPGNESSVPVYVDDAYYSRLFVPYLAFAGNVERVEVLKGPQGTLFGRNATGGLIHIVTKDPGQEPAFRAKVGYGSQQTLTGQAYMSTPISDEMAIDFSIIGQDMGSGFGKNLFNGKDTYYRDFLTLRSKLVWEPSDTTTVKLSGLYAYDKSSVGTVGGGVVEGFPRGEQPGGGLFTPPEGFYDVNVNYDTQRKHEGYAFTLRIDQEMNFADFTSISFFRDSEEPWTSEGDHTDIRWLEYDLEVEDKQFTQELQLKSKEDSSFDWIFGLYYMDAKAAYNPVDIKGLALEGGGLEVQTLYGEQKIESKAAFGQATFPFNGDKTRLSAGLRYTDDKVKGHGQTYATFLGDTTPTQLAPDYVDSASFDKVTYKVSVDHDLTEDLMGYVSYSRGYKSGVFNLLPLSAPAIPPEVVDAYEVGFKGSLSDGMFRFSIAGFWNDIKEFQTNIIEILPGGIATVQLANAPKARTRGVEFTADANVSENLTIRSSGQYIDAKYIDFTNAPISVLQETSPYGVTQTIGDVSGERLPQIPKWKFNIGFDYSQESEVGGWLFSANMAYRSGFPWEPDGLVKADDLVLLNTSLEFSPNFAEGTSIRIWAKNLTDEKYLSNVLTQVGATGVMASPAEGRTWGVELGYTF